MIARLGQAVARLQKHHGSAVPEMGGKGDKGKGKAAAKLDDVVNSGFVAKVARAMLAVAGEQGGGKGKGFGKGEAGFKPGDWYCEVCGFHNFASRWECHQCIGTRGAEKGKGKGKGASKGGAKGDGKGIARRNVVQGPVGGNGQRPMLAWSGRSTGGATGVASEEAKNRDSRGQDNSTVSNAGGEWTAARKRKTSPPATGKPQSGVRTSNEWSAFMEDELSDDDAGINVDEDLRVGRADEEDGLEDEGDGSGGEDDDGDEDEAEDWNEEVPNRVEQLQRQCEADNEMVRALQHRPKWDAARTRAKEVAAESRRVLDEARLAEREQWPAQARMQTLQRKIGKATRKLEGIREEEQELRKYFQEEIAELDGRENDWSTKLQEWNEQLGACCREVAADATRAEDTRRAAPSRRGVTGAGQILQQLLSSIENEEHRDLVATAAKLLAEDEDGTAQEGEGPKYFNVADGDAEGVDEDKGRRRAAPVAPPETWMREGPKKPLPGAGKTDETHKGEAIKQARLGNTAERFEAAKQNAGRPPTHEEEVEMARRVVSAADDKYKGQSISEEDKRAILAEASREMAMWIYRQSPQLHAGSRAEDYAVQMATMARCNDRVQEAVALLAARRLEDARAAEAAAAAGGGSMASA